MQRKIIILYQYALQSIKHLLRFKVFLFAVITYNVSDLIKKIQKIVKKARKPIKKL